MPLGNRQASIGQRRHLVPTLGQPATVDLERGQMLQGLIFGFSGAVTVADEKNTRAKTKRGDELALIKRLAIYANSNDALIDMTGDDLWWSNRYYFGCQPNTNTQIGGGAASGTETTARPFVQHLFVPFVQGRSSTPEDTLLNTRTLTNFSARVEFGVATDVNGDATAASITNCFFQPYGFSRRVPVAPEPIYSVSRRRVIEVNVSGANPNFRVPLTPGPIYRSFLFNTRDSSGNDAQIVTDVSLKVGNTTIMQGGWNMLSDINDLITGLGLPWNGALRTGTGAYQHIRQSSVSSRAGWSNMDLSLLGKLSEALDSNELGDLALEFNATAQGTIRIISNEVTPAGRNIMTPDGIAPVVLTIGA